MWCTVHFTKDAFLIYNYLRDIMLTVTVRIEFIDIGIEQC